MIPKWVGGASNHVHLLATLPTICAVAKAVQLIKGGSSARIHQTFPNLRNFACQQGYGAFSVGISQVRSITTQETRRTFRRKIPLGLGAARSYRTLRDGFLVGTLSQALRAWLRSGCPSGTWLAAIFATVAAAQTFRTNFSIIGKRKIFGLLGAERISENPEK
jgi:hypothetical protein